MVGGRSGVEPDWTDLQCWALPYGRNALPGTRPTNGAGPRVRPAPGSGERREAVCRRLALPRIAPMDDPEITPEKALAAVTLRPMPAPSGKPPEARFGERLREARRQLGLSVEACSRLCKAWGEAEGMGLSPPTLGR